jgi:GT2 family glycosyltransferase
MIADRRTAPVTTQPRVSILLPVRNAEATLPACIESLRTQTLTDWECLAVDDHSTDRSRELLEAWAAEDARARVLSAPAPGGLVHALETVRCRARAPLLARQDADDRSLPERLERQAAAMDADRDVTVIGCRTVTPGTITDGMRRHLRWLDRCVDVESCDREIWIESPLAHPTVVMRAEAIDRIGGYRDMGWPEDYDLWLRLHVDGGRMYNIKERLYIWTDHPGRLSRRDARYSPGAFLRCRLHHLRRWLSERAAGRPLVVWGAGRDGSRLARAWEEELGGAGPAAEAIAAFIDIDPRKVGRTRRGLPVGTLEEARRRFPEAFYVVAVGVAGARERIRPELESTGAVEGRDFLCLH